MRPGAQDEVSSLRRDLAEALEQQRALTDVLSMTSRSAFDLAPVLQTVIENAVRLSSADGGSVVRIEGSVGSLAASVGMNPEDEAEMAEFYRSHPFAPGRASLTGRVLMEGHSVQIADVQADPEYERPTRSWGFRSLLGVPLARPGAMVGILVIRRRTPGAFSPGIVKLVEAFADQAAIAIENVRLFNETKEALGQQSAIADVLKTISRSAFDLKPVLDTVVENAARLCGADAAWMTSVEGDDMLVPALAHFGIDGQGRPLSVELEHLVISDTLADLTGPEQVPTVAGLRRRLTIGRSSIIARPAAERRSVVSDDITTDPTLAESRFALRVGVRSVLGVPMIREGDPIGVLVLARHAVRPFSQREIELAETFAAQAAIAIENVRLFNETKEALEHQRAIAEILEVVSRSPDDVQPVLDAIVASAAKLTDAHSSAVFRADAEHLTVVAARETYHAKMGNTMSLDAMTVPSVAFRTQRTVHVEDVRQAPQYPQGPPMTRLAVPIATSGRPYGALIVGRRDVQPFTDRQVQLIETFARQAGIAIENVRLFNETKEALEQQKAITEVLASISGSPTDVLPVLGTISRNAAHLCDARYAAVVLLEHGVLIGHTAQPDGSTFRSQPISVEGSVSGRAIRERRTVHVEDLLATDEFPATIASRERSVASGRDVGSRTALAVPLMRQGEAIGTIFLRRAEVRRFSDREIALVETFSRQAVIAIENVRLFNETKESLQRQTAISEILRVISSSPTDVQPVLETIALSAARYCGADDAGVVTRGADDTFLITATQGGVAQAPLGFSPAHRSVTPQAIKEARVFNVADMDALPDDEFGEGKAYAREHGYRGFLAAPLLKDGRAVGAIQLRRARPGAFSPQEVDLVQTFAAQAVIALDNVRLFNETKEALDRQTATSEVLKTISRSAFDLQSVLDTLIENAARLCKADVGWLASRSTRFMAAAGLTPAERQALDDEVTVKLAQSPEEYRPGVMRRMLTGGSRVHIHDISADPDLADASPALAVMRGRTVLAVPVRQQESTTAGIVLVRREVSPFSDREIELLETFADQAAIAIENVRLFNETKEALERETATSTVLTAISESGFDLQPMFDRMIAEAARICRADFGNIYLRRSADGPFGSLWSGYLTAAYNVPPELDPDRANVAIGDAVRAGATPADLAKKYLGMRVILEGRTVEVPDVREDPGLAPNDTYSRLGVHAVLGVPLRRGDQNRGTITLWKKAPGPFEPHAVELVERFADQAVIALENVRLFNETKEALEQQRATAEVLKVISRSAFDLQPVFDTVVRNAVRLCTADNASIYRRDGEVYRHVAIAAKSGDATEEAALHEAFTDRIAMPPGRWSTVGRVLLEHRTVQIPDARVDPEYAAHVVVPAHNIGRALIGVPISRENEILGVMLARRYEPGPFDDREVTLLETFADQAAIAIENVRLFNETKESLGQQTAISEVLQSISRSAFDLDSVLSTIVENAARMCGADRGLLWRRHPDGYRATAPWGNFSAADLDTLLSRVHQPDTTGVVVSRAAATGRPVQVEDARGDPAYADLQTSGRTRIGVPLLRDGEPIGVLVLGRPFVKAFTDREIALVETFARQAVIAIENVRLFNETKEALEQQEAISEILEVISRSPSDLQPVFDAVIDRAFRLCEADNATLLRRTADGFVSSARAGRPMGEDERAFMDRFIPGPRTPERETLTGRVLLERATVRIEDALNDPEYFVRRAGIQPEQVPSGFRRSLIGVPLIQKDEVVGVIVVRRLEIRPFTDRDQRLLEAFADQAVIAIENVRLFNETKEALEQQTAVAEILKTISRSAFDLRPVLETLVEQAARLCEADHGSIHRWDGSAYRTAAFWGPELSDEYKRVAFSQPRPPARDTLIGRTGLTRDVVHITDVLADPEYAPRDLQSLSGYRTVLGVPLIREGFPIGVFGLMRNEVKPFTDRQIELVRTFADQAAIAMENVRLFNEIHDKSRQLEVASRHKSEFLANMSHELRTPLNAIIGFTDVMLQEMFGPLNEKQKEYLEDVRGSGTHLLTLINDILDLSKIEAGRVELEPTEFSLADAVENALTLVRERASRHGITLAADIASDVGTITADERKVKQIVVNLLTNAVKFTPGDGWVGITARCDGDHVEVAVRDTGIGIAPEDQDRVFEEFQQVGKDPERSREGTGLGLTLSKRFVELHGGRIWVESEVGKGSTFTFTIPLRQTATAPVGA